MEVVAVGHPFCLLCYLVEVLSHLHLPLAKCHHGAVGKREGLLLPF